MKNPIVTRYKNNPILSVKIYWGGADSVMCIGSANINELVDLCLNNPRKAL